MPQTYVEALRALADQVEARERAEGRARALEPAAASWNELARSTGNYSLRQAAFILNQCPSIDIGQNRLMKVLIEFGMVGEDRLPHAKHRSHVALRPQSYVHPQTGERRLAKPQVRLTVLGIQYVHRRLRGGGKLEYQRPWD